MVQYGADTLSSYDVSFSPGETKPRSVTNPDRSLADTPHPQLKLFASEEAPGKGGWLRVLELDEHAARSWSEPESLRGYCSPD